jgi:hypothetical protein
VSSSTKRSGKAYDQRPWAISSVALHIEVRGGFAFDGRDANYTYNAVPAEEIAILPSVGLVERGEPWARIIGFNA